MNTRKLKTILFTALLLVLSGLVGCGQKNDSEENLCHIVLEDGEGYHVTEPARTVEAGSNVNFTVTLDNSWQFLGTDYHGKADIIKDNDGKTVELVLYKVKYSESVCIQAEKGKYEITYDANGGKTLSDKTDKVKKYYRGTHQRINTSIGTDLFYRDGYTLLGWNTRADGTGEAVGLGSRTAWKKGLVLYAQWVPWSAEENFVYKKVSGFAVITGYIGNEQQICVPPNLGGLPVRTIREQAFADTDCRTVILSPGIYEIEKWAFKNSRMEQMYLYDDLMKVSDYAFQDCDMLRTLHINAIEAPAYSGNYFDTFQDKYDRLLSLKDKKKMGVFAYSPALPQLELIRSCMKEGDILLDSPEFDAANRQFCYQKELDYATFAMMESNYDAFAGLDLREYTQVFTAFSAYQTAREDMERKSYDICAADYDEDGHETEESSYNEYGDYVLYRPNSTKEGPIYGLPVNYTVNAFPQDTYIDSINAEFQKFMDEGIKVYFTYSPRNKYALSKESTEEERARLHEYFKSQLHIPVISELEDSLYTGIYLYGTDNHLSTEGAQIRTERVIRDLKEQLAKEEKE